MPPSSALLMNFAHRGPLLSLLSLFSASIWFATRVGSVAPVRSVHPLVLTPLIISELSYIAMRVLGTARKVQVVGPSRTSRVVRTTCQRRSDFGCTRDSPVVDYM